MKVFCNKTFDEEEEEKKGDEEEQAHIQKLKNYLLALFKAILKSKMLEHAYFEIKLEIKYRVHLEEFLEETLKQEFARLVQNEEIMLIWNTFTLSNNQKHLRFRA